MRHITNTAGTPTLRQRIVRMLRPEAALVAVGSVVVIGGLAYCYDVWRRRNRPFDGPDHEDFHPDEPNPPTSFLNEEDPVDEALDESFPASDPPSFTARGRATIEPYHPGAKPARIKVKQAPRKSARRA